MHCFGENITIVCHVQSLPELYDLKWIFNGSGINSSANLIFNEVENNHTLFVLEMHNKKKYQRLEQCHNLIEKS
jgi:hypothetical protein